LLPALLATLLLLPGLLLSTLLAALLLATLLLLARLLIWILILIHLLSFPNTNSKRTSIAHAPRQTTMRCRTICSATHAQL